jgi:DNA helicase-2/ATP-dependent DNA helicase PcrA
MECLEWLLSKATSAANPEHAIVQLLGPQPVLIDAPAGCGKTQALAERARALVACGAVVAPRQILAVTFSNKAKDNLRSRLREVFGIRYWERVHVTNFHGLARRLILAHGESVGLDRDVGMPMSGWLREARAEVGIGWETSAQVDQHLHEAKSQPRTDEQVMDQLTSVGDELALAYEKHLRNEKRLDYWDLLRYADLILAIDEIAILYRHHFPIVMVDELQDLTPQQLRMVLSVCGQGLTAAGDKAQGIYSFAGAEPEAVYATVRGLEPAVVNFTLSYRAAPRVLEAVNATARLQGANELVCATPDDWPDEGHVLTLVRETRTAEAKALVDWAGGVLKSEPTPSIGVISRRSVRGDEFRAACEASGLDLEVWSDATHNPRIIALLRRNFPRALKESDNPKEQLNALLGMCIEDISPEDIELRDELLNAIATFREQSDLGMTLGESVSRCRVAPPRDAPVAAGLHLLTAHSGKGQQFDWVVALGLEEGKLPDFRATDVPALEEELRVLHVILSRARVGLVLSRSLKESNQYGRVFDVTPSRWWDPVADQATGEI